MESAPSIAVDTSTTSNERSGTTNPTFSNLPFDIKCMVFDLLFYRDTVIEILPTKGSGYVLWDLKQLDKKIREEVENWWSTKTLCLQGSGKWYFDTQRTNFFADLRPNQNSGRNTRNLLAELRQVCVESPLRGEIRHMRIDLRSIFSESQALEERLYEGCYVKVYKEDRGVTSSIRALENLENLEIICDGSELNRIRRLWPRLWPLTQVVYLSIGPRMHFKIWFPERSQPAIFSISYCPSEEIW